MSDKAIEAAIHAFFADVTAEAPTEERIRAAIAAYEQAMWQPIEIAPKDGEDVLLLMWGNTQIVCSFDDATSDPEYPWLTLDGPSYHYLAPTHWRPLPPPPEDGA